MTYNVKNIIRNLPADLRNDLNRTWNVPQNLKWHPEGNTFKHIYITLQRACDIGNKTLIMAALFHDLGKWDTLAFNIETRQPSAHGHERLSCFYVYKYRQFIKNFGADPLDVFWIVKNHMRVKNLYDMKRSKQNKLKKHHQFINLLQFTHEVDGGGWYTPEKLKI